jgi:hypothetical protein
MRFASRADKERERDGLYANRRTLIGDFDRCCGSWAEASLGPIGAWLIAATWRGRARPKNVGCLRAIVRGKVCAGPTPAVGEIGIGTAGPAG